MAERAFHPEAPANYKEGRPGTKPKLKPLFGEEEAEAEDQGKPERRAKL